MKRINCVVFFIIFSITFHGFTANARTQKDLRVIKKDNCELIFTKKSALADCLKISEKKISCKKGKKIRGLNSDLIYIACRQCCSISFTDTNIFNLSGNFFYFDQHYYNGKRGPPVS